MKVNIIQVVAFKMYLCPTHIQILHLTEFQSLTDFPHLLEIF